MICEAVFKESIKKIQKLPILYREDSKDLTTIPPQLSPIIMIINSKIKPQLNEELINNVNSNLRIIKVKLLNGLSDDFPFQNKLSDLKNSIQRHYNIPPTDQMRILYKGKVLKANEYGQDDLDLEELFREESQPISINVISSNLERWALMRRDLKSEMFALLIKYGISPFHAEKVIDLMENTFR